MLNKAEQFKGVGSHHNVAATLMALLSHKYGLKFPAELPFIGGVLDNSKNFHSDVHQPIMRNKNDLSCYVLNNTYLTDGTVYTIADGMKLERTRDPKTERQITAQLKEFQRLNLMVCDEDRLFNGKMATAITLSYILNKEEQQFLIDQKIRSLGADQQFFKARDFAMASEYDKSRIVLKNILNAFPNYSDVRILMGRTYAWQERYPEARTELKEAIRRSPGYDDGYSALVDCEIYADRRDSARYWLQQGIKNADDNTTLIQKEKSVKSLGKSK